MRPMQHRWSKLARTVFHNSAPSNSRHQGSAIMCVYSLAMHRRLQTCATAHTCDSKTICVHSNPVQTVSSAASGNKMLSGRCTPLTSPTVV